MKLQNLQKFGVPEKSFLTIVLQLFQVVTGEEVNLIRSSMHL